MTEILAIAPATKVIIATGNETREHALRAIALGAYDFYQKPIDIDVLQLIVSRAEQMFELEDENRRLIKGVAASPIDGIIASSPEMLQVLRNIEKIAPTDVSVLLLGESGTGKELLAQAIHKMSRARRRARSSPINCAAIPETLLESELFGHEKGAFTGARQAEYRQDRKRRPRHAVPRRNRRYAAADAGQAAALPAGPDRRAGRRPQAGAGRCADRLRDQPESRSADGAKAASARTSTTG